MNRPTGQTLGGRRPETFVSVPCRRSLCTPSFGSDTKDSTATVVVGTGRVQDEVSTSPNQPFPFSFSLSVFLPRYSSCLTSSCLHRPKVDKWSRDDTCFSDPTEFRL